MPKHLGHVKEFEVQLEEFRDYYDANKKDEYAALVVARLKKMPFLQSFRFDVWFL